MAQHVSVVVIGAGLSGLHTAWQLQKQNVSVLVLEARDRIGGRAYSPNQCDIGPAWLWPSMQPRLSQLMAELNINAMPQFTDGDKFIQLSEHRIERYNDVSPHAQSFRVPNGVESLCDAIQGLLDGGCVQLNAQVSAITQDSNKIKVRIENSDEIVTADRVVLALPPRVFLQHIECEPKLDKSVVEVLNAVPTWMAGQAKITVVYEHAFWKENNVSGEAMSHVGPLSEITDACSVDEKIAALSAFVSWPAEQRALMGEQPLINACLNQLQQFFGDAALKPLFVQFKDWAQDNLTCSDVDYKTQSQHPHFDAAQSRALWNGQLILSGSELALEHGGYLEGAIESSMKAIELLNQLP